MRTFVGSFTTASSVSTHSLALQPVGIIALTASTASPDTTQKSIAALAVGIAQSTASDLTVGYNVLQLGGTAKVASTVGNGITRVASTDNSTSIKPLAVLDTASVQVSGANNPPAIAYLLLGADDVDVRANTTVAILSTVAPSTQSSTGVGFAPNAVIVLGQALGSSVARASFGFACQTSDGTIKQWSIDQCAREADNINAARSASTVSALKLHTTGTTSFDVTVSSFLADGIELTVNATDTADAARYSVMQLSVPKVDAGKATITTDGLGPGVTGINVTGLGANVSLVILASIWSSLQTLQADNAWSIGFASSNGSQRCVSGYVNDIGVGSNTSHFASFFSTSKVLFLTSADGGTSGAVRKSEGTFALTTDGFSVQFLNTANAAHGDIYWAAFMNEFVFPGSVIQSSFSANSGIKETDHIGASIASSFTLASGMRLVDLFGASIASSFTLASGMRLVDLFGASIASSFTLASGMRLVDLFGASIASSFTLEFGVLPDFVPGEGKIHGHFQMQAGIAADASISLGHAGHEEASDRFLIVSENSSSPDLEKTVDVSTDRTRLGIAEFGNARFLTVTPPSTNTVPLRIAGGRSAEGIPLSSVGMSLLSLGKRSASDAYLFTTSTGSTVEGVKVRIG